MWQWILKLPLFVNHQNLCLFMIYQFVLQMIVPWGQLATLDLPPVIQIPNDDIELVVDPGCLNNPLQSPVRPSESVHDDEDLDTAVKFGDLGVFDSRALDIWMKASKASSIKFRVQEEENWMKTTSTTLTLSRLMKLGLCFWTVKLN